MKFIWLKRLFGKSRKKNSAKQAPKPFALPDLKFHIWLPAAALCAAVLLGIGALGYSLDRPVRTVEAVGSFHRVSVLDVEKTVRSDLHGGFVLANIGQVQTALEKLPWVDQVRVQRRWPDALIIQITEQEAVARWGDSGLINARGELFVRDEQHVPQELPKLTGPDGTERRVADLFFQIRDQVEAANLSLEGLRLDDRGAWEVELADGVTVRLGRREIQERFDRFLKSAASLIASRGAEISFIDMRYSNGFSIGWRGAQTQAG